MNSENTPSPAGAPQTAIAKRHALPSAGFDAMQELRKNLMSSIPKLDHQLAPSRKLVEGMMATPLQAARVGAAMKPLLDSQRLWQQSLAVAAFSSSLGSIRLPKIPAFKIPRIDPAIGKLAAIDWRALQARDEQALRFAARHNWFIQPETDCTFAADIDGCGSDIDRLDAVFMAMTGELLPMIQARLTADFPSRAPLFHEIFRLHEERRYLACVPLTLMCAEGIALDVCNTSIFNTRGTRPKIAEWLDKQTLSDLAKVFLSSLSEPHPMSKPRAGQLCRHEVLHGRAIDYGSQRHSLQAISLLGLVGWTFAADGLVTDRKSEG